MNNHHNFTLLTDGAAAFPRILECIAAAEKSIDINMFIWRDDYIGNAIGRALLQAADRGVNINLSVDRLGAVLEKAEEYQSSFFHRQLTVAEKLKAKIIQLFYPGINTQKRSVDKSAALFKAIVNHKNINASFDIQKADHSKYYIFDDCTIIMGGINIEDKENGRDISGRVYQDYMIKMKGAEYVRNLKTALSGGYIPRDDYGFAVNAKNCTPPVFGFEKHYLDIINGATKELLIAMAYFAPPKKILQAVIRAANRGIKVTVMIPAHSNMMSNASLKAVKRLMKATDNRINLYLTPKMMHTKLMANEKLISLGSANMMKNTFDQLGELNLYVYRCHSRFCNRLLNSVEENISLAQHITHHKQLHYSAIKALFEGLM